MIQSPLGNGYGRSAENPKENCETSQELYCHEACPEQALQDPKDLYLKGL